MSRYLALDKLIGGTNDTLLDYIKITHFHIHKHTASQIIPLILCDFSSRKPLLDHRHRPKVFIKVFSLIIT